MKKYIITSFALIFIFAGIGSGVSLYHLLSTTANLRNLVNLHEIEDVRQTLSFNFQKIQSYTFSSQAYLTDHIDEIIDNAKEVNQTLVRCNECHHKPEVEAELKGVEAMVQEYQEQLSYLITTVTEEEHRREQQGIVADQGNLILTKIQDMVNRAASTLNLETSNAMNKIEESYIILGLTLIFTFLAAQVVAHFLTSRITNPVDKLLNAANRITQGELGYQIDYKGPGEFQALISTFNTMSASLARQEDKIRNTMKKLHQLSHMTLPLHTALDTSTIINYLHKTMSDLIAAEYVGIMLPEGNNEQYVLHLFDTSVKNNESRQFTFSQNEIKGVFDDHSGQPLLDNSMQNKNWPFAEKPEGVEFNNLLLTWMFIENNVTGALIAINKNEGNFSEEDSEIVGILANNMNVALDNIGLFNNLQQQMVEQKKTQRQLLEAEKLTALGALAGGIAHDFNNILCGMIGYVSLLKRNHNPEDKDFKMLDTIENAGFRAADLTKQLLTFSRQEALGHRPIEVNSHIENIAKMLENTISKLITFRLELKESLPKVSSNPAQLEQIIMNLCVNARDAMPGGGEILIRSEQVDLNRTFCGQHPEAKPGDYIKLTVTDQGEGIDQDILPKIFEPFFTTKDFGRGTGLGLAMVYGIVKSHKGFIIVSSSKGKETTFSVYLPIIDFIEAAEIKPAVSDELIRAGILIVDGEDLVASMLAEHLQNHGCHTFHAGDGEEALEILQQNKNGIDVVILDFNMPVMDGKTAYEEMVKLKPGLKVLIASAYSQDSSVEDILTKGANGFIQKPYRIDNIILKIRKVMQG
jgi:signal transduction histidine kinase/HAMP domain-containing protein